MRLLFVADGRSSIALDWISNFVERGHEVHMVSTFPCEPPLKLASLQVIPVAFSSLKSGISSESRDALGASIMRGENAIRFRTALRRWLAPLTFRQAALRLQRAIREINPDLVHAMRIPFEGMLAAAALESLDQVRLVVSVWGNDFTLHARSTHWMAQQTRKSLLRADGLHTDCQRDARLASEWGFPKGNPAIVAPGNGGVKMDIFYPPREFSAEREFTLINPRGFRAYVRNDTFFRALPSVIKRWPQVKALCPDMAGKAEALRWVEGLGLQKNVELLSKLSRSEMAYAFRRAAISVSPTTHDGTPNTLLEGMACGCFPIAGDLESVREWIEPGKNGLVFDPTDHLALEAALRQVLEDSRLRSNAAERNLQIVRQQAEYSRVMERVDEFYIEICT